MKANRKTAIGAALALALGVAAAVVNAHPYGYGGPAGPGMGWGPGGHGPGFAAGYGPGRSADPAAAVDARLGALKSELKISAPQENAWNSYAEALKTQAQSMQSWRATMFDRAQGSALERSESHTQAMKQHQQQAERTGAAFKDLYAALTPEQKTIADQRLGFGMGVGNGPGRGMRFR